MSALEEVQCCGLTLHLPTDLSTDFSLLTEIVSPETWNNCLTDDNRQALMNLLPTFPDNDLEEKTRTLEMFFMDVNFRFGTPLRHFHQQLQQGHFNPAIAKYRQKREARKRILCRYQYREYLHNTLEDTIIRRQQYLELASSLPPDTVPSPLAHLSVSLSLPGGSRFGGSLSPQIGADIPNINNGPPPPWRGTVEHRTKRRYFRELMSLRVEAGISSELSEDENYPEGPSLPVSKKQRRQLVGAESSLPQHLLPVRHSHSTGSLAKDLQLLIAPGHNPLDLTDAHLHSIIDKYIWNKRNRRKTGEISIAEDIQGISLSDVIGRASQNSKRPLPLTLPSTSARGEGGRHSTPRPRIKKEKLSSSSSAAASRPLSFASASVKVEDEEDDEFNHLSLEPQQHAIKAEPEDEELSSLSRFITLASGEVRNEGGGVAEGEEPEEKQALSSPALAAAKTRMFGTVSKAASSEVPGSSASSAISSAANGTYAVKEEPQDPDMTCSGQGMSGSSSSVLAAPSPSLPSCFLCLLRDLICQPREQRLSRAVIESSARSWLLSTAASSTLWFTQLPSLTVWLQALPSAVNFLAGFTADVQPPDFVPYLEYKPSLQAYQWIGAGRDTDSKLQLLYQFWMNNRSSMSNSWMVSYNSINGASNCVAVSTDSSSDPPSALGLAGPSVEELLAGEDDGGLDEEPIPPARCPTTWTVQPASMEERQAYRQQERMRYEKPHRAFTYRAHGYESVVGPVKGIYSQHSGPNKARGHSLLTPNRPPYVTILALVRDAVSRLPNGEGTRAEICELLRESQYLSPLQSSSAETALHSVVSGALDRLHYEQDPCVKYLANRKMWVYLHRNRDEHEFERMHHLNGPGGTKNKRPPLRRHPRPKTAVKEQLKPPPNVAIDPLNTSVMVEGGQVKMRPEDVLVKHDSTSANNKLFTQVVNSASSTIINKVNLLSSSSSTTVSATSQNTLPTIASASAVLAGTISAAVSSVSPSVVTLSNSPARQRSVDGIVSSIGGGITTSTLSALKVSSNTASSTAGMRTLVASNLQTIQVSTASGIQTIRVALPASSAHHFAKGALVGRLAGASGVVAINSRPGKKQQQTIGQIIQTSSGAQFIATGLSSGTVGQLSPVGNRKASSSNTNSQVLKYGPQQQQAVVLAAPSGLPLSGHLAGGASVVAGGAASGGRAVVISATSEGHVQGSASLSSTNPSVYGGVVAKNVFAMSGGAKSFLQTATASRAAATAVVTSNTQAILAHRAGGGMTTSNGGAGPASSTSNSTVNLASVSGSSNMELVYTNKGKSGVVSSNAAIVVSSMNNNNTSPTVVVAGDSGTRAVQSISAHQLAGLKLIQTSVAAHHLQQGGGQTVLGQKLVMSGNKVLVQGGKVMQAGVQQLVALQQQKALGASGATGGLQRVTLMATQSGQGGTASGYSSSGIITTTAPGAQQRLLLGTHPTASGGTSSGQIGGLVTMSGGGGKQVVVEGAGTKTGTLSQQLSAGTVQGQLVLHGDKLGQVMIGGDKVTGQMMASIGGQQLVLTTAGGSGGQQQQLVLPASALQGGHIALKGLQSFHTLKVIPSGGVIGGTSAKGRPMLARVVQQPSPRARVAPTQANVTRPLLSTVTNVLSKQQNTASLQPLNISSPNNVLTSVSATGNTMNNSNESVDISSANSPNL